MMSRRTVKIIVYVIVIAMLVTTLFSFVFFLPRGQQAHALSHTVMKESTYTSQSYSNQIHSSLRAQNLYAMVPPEQQRFLTEQLRELERFIKFLQENFKDEVDFSTLTQGAFEGAINSLGDPNSSFFTDADEGQTFIENVVGHFGGIGVTMRQNAEGLCEVTDVVAGGPAEAAGIRRGDIITRVDGRDVTQMNIDEISRLLRGEEDTRVEITIRRGTETLTFSITRAIIRISRVNYGMLEGNIGYIRLSGFDAGGVGEFRAAVANLTRSGAQSLILDLRYNMGGLISAALDIADEFISDEYLVHLARRGEIVESDRATSRVSVSLDTVVLVNEYTASAAEIVAGALRDNGVATIVGTRTHGKGTVQTIFYTHDRRPYRISLYYILTPNGHAINEVGIVPDYVVRNRMNETDRVLALSLYKMFAPFVEDARAWPGESGLNVFAAQQRLLILGYTPGITGVMDTATVNAISEFQRDTGLYVYGVLDFTTMRRIREVTAAHVNNASLEDYQLLKAIELLSN